MIVAGFGLRSGVSLAALEEALARAGGDAGVTHLAVLEAKAEALAPLARKLALPVLALDAGALRGVPTLTQSDRVAVLFGTGSVSEAAAVTMMRSNGA